MPNSDLVKKLKALEFKVEYHAHSVDVTMFFTLDDDDLARIFTVLNKAKVVKKPLEIKA